MIKSILIANRGEIAVRIAHTCHEMGIKTIGVYSEADRNALHTQSVSEAYYIGDSPAKESYLNADKIIEIAKLSHADAIHPGYGFLSENADFAELVEKCGLIWIGPPASAIRAMGSKTSARSLMKKVGVSVVPGTDGVVASIKEAEDFVKISGFPILLKASAGGGGKGMRVVTKKEELESSFQAAQREALASFGDEAVYAEKFIENPKHIEIQIFADKHGNTVYLGERECSVQRRHQKIVEESPSPSIDNAQRQKMGEMAVMAAKACRYVNAGTIECLLDQDGSFYFLEMNTRLQVEHPVTESVTGLDLVRMQIEVANDKKLSLKQSDVTLRGHAIETRIYAEDVVNGFLPSTGKLKRFCTPTAPGVRHDIGYREGDEVSRFYDPMLAKLIVYAENRDAAINKSLNALENYQISGVNTNISFSHYILSSQKFNSNNFYTNTIDKTLLSEYILSLNTPQKDENVFVAAMVKFITDSQKKQTIKTTANSSKWKISEFC